MASILLAVVLGASLGCKSWARGEGDLRHFLPRPPWIKEAEYGAAVRVKCEGAFFLWGRGRWEPSKAECEKACADLQRGPECYEGCPKYR